MRVCVIGAGMSGIVAAKHLREAGVDFDWFEKSSELGGVWCYREDPTVFSIYDCCRTIGCKHNMSFSDHPVPDGMNEYPTHREFYEYLMGYVERFGLRERVRTRCDVQRVGKTPDGRWHVRLANGEEHDYDHLVVTTGQFRVPFSPHYDGEFAGTQLHSAYYRTPDPYRGKRVLVVGMGNSGVDIAVDLSHVAETTHLSTREGAHIIPKYILGKPFLHFHSPIDDYVPFQLNQVLTQLVAWAGRGPLSAYSFPRPERPVLLKNPTVSDQILGAVRDGRVTIKPAIAALDGDGVKFVDGSRSSYDAIVYATGYTTQFEFFDPELLAFEREKFRNYLHVANIDHANLYFVGIVDPFGTYPKIVELQSKVITGVICGRLSLPPIQTMKEEMAHTERTMRRVLADDSSKPMIREKFFRYQHRLQRFEKRSKRAPTPTRRERTTMNTQRVLAAGTETTVLEAGSGQPVVFLHGVPDSHIVWKPAIEHLRAKFRCIAPDLHGFGDSRAPHDFDLSLHNRAYWLNEVIDAVGVDGPVDLVCHDFGGPTGLAWAVENPDRVRRLIVSATCFHREWRWHSIAKAYRTPVLGDLVIFFQKSKAIGWPLFVKEMQKGSKGIPMDFLEKTYEAANNGHVPKNVLRLYRETPPSIFTGWDTRLYKLVEQRPTLCLWSAQDPYVPLDLARKLEARGATIHQFAGVGHWIQIEATDEFVAQCEKFLA